MPLFDFRCEVCEARHELLAKVGEVPTCPICGTGTMRKLITAPAAMRSRPSAVPFAPPATGRAPPGPTDKGHVHTASCRHGYAEALVKKHLG